MRVLIVLTLAAALLAGCGSDTNQTAGGTPAPTGKSAPGATEGSSASPAPTISPANDTGIPIYPGAKVLTRHDKDKTVNAEIETTDPFEKVVAYYEKELSAKRKGNESLVTIEGAKGEYSYGIVIAPKQGGLTAVSVL